MNRHTPVGSIDELVSSRRAQGWRVKVQVGASTRSQLVEVHCAEASTISVTFEAPPGKSPSVCDDTGTVDVETRIGEAIRTRSFPTRFAGISTNVPSGITRIFLTSTIAGDWTGSVQVSPGIATQERIAVWAQIAGGAAIVVPVLPFARLVTVGATDRALMVATPSGNIDVYPPSELVPRVVQVTIPALAFTSITNTTPNATSACLIYEIQS